MASCFAYYAELAEKLDGRQWQPVELGDDDFKCCVRREALGAVALVTPWNYPMLMATVRTKQLGPASVTASGGLLCRISATSSDGVVHGRVVTSPDQTVSDIRFVERVNSIRPFNLLWQQWSATTGAQAHKRVLNGTFGEGAVEGGACAGSGQHRHPEALRGVQRHVPGAGRHRARGGRAAWRLQRRHRIRRRRWCTSQVRLQAGDCIQGSSCRDGAQLISRARHETL